MSRTLERIRDLITRWEVQISDHGYDELVDDDLFIDDILAGLTAAVVVEDYPTIRKVLVCSFFNGMERVSQSMLFGEFLKTRSHQQSW
jgi:hypothetical protein